MPFLRVSRHSTALPLGPLFLAKVRGTVGVTVLGPVCARAPSTPSTLQMCSPLGMTEFSALFVTRGAPPQLLDEDGVPSPSPMGCVGPVTTQGLDL